MLPHLRGHHRDLLGRNRPTQHVLLQLRVFGVLQVRDAAPHSVFVFHVGVLDILVDAYRAVKESAINPEASEHFLHRS